MDLSNVPHERMRAELAARSWLTVSGVLSDAELENLRVEAAKQRPFAHGRFLERASLGSEGRLLSQSAHWAAAPGLALAELHEDARTRDFVCSLAGRRLFPTRATYLYYPRGGFVGLHTDIHACSVTLLIGLTPGLDDLVVHPELVDADPTTLLDLAVRHGGIPLSGTSVRYPENGWLVIQGATLPHHRPPATRPCTVATICFGALG